MPTAGESKNAGTGSTCTPCWKVRAWPRKLGGKLGRQWQGRGAALSRVPKLAPHVRAQAKHGPSEQMIESIIGSATTNRALVFVAQGAGPDWNFLRAEGKLKLSKKAKGEDRGRADQTEWLPIASGDVALVPVQVERGRDIPYLCHFCKQRKYRHFELVAVVVLQEGRRETRKSGRSISSRSVIVSHLC